MEGPGHLGFYHTRCQIRSHSQVPRWTKFGRDTGRSPHTPPVHPSDTPVALSRAALWLAVHPLRCLWETVSHVGGGPARLAPWSAGTQGPPLGEPGVQALPGTWVELPSGGGGPGARRPAHNAGPALLGVPRGTGAHGSRYLAAGRVLQVSLQGSLRDALGGFFSIKCSRLDLILF